MHADVGMVSLQVHTNTSQKDICRDVTDEVRCHELPSVRWKIRTLTLPASCTLPSDLGEAFVLAIPSHALGSSSGNLGFGNCLFQIYWSGQSGLSPGPHPLETTPAEISSMAIPHTRGEIE